MHFPFWWADRLAEKPPRIGFVPKRSRPRLKSASIHARSNINASVNRSTTYRMFERTKEELYIHDFPSLNSWRVIFLCRGQNSRPMNQSPPSDEKNKQARCALSDRHLFLPPYQLITLRFWNIICSPDHLLLLSPTAAFFMQPLFQHITL